MIGNTYHNSETTIYNAPAICIPSIGSITFPANPSFDSAATGPVIYMHLTSSTGPEAQQLNELGFLPIINDSGLSYGGEALAYAARVTPKLVLEGYIDTPCVQANVVGSAIVPNANGQWYVSQVIDSNGIRYMYPEILAMMVEGRANIQSSGSWERLDPLWYRDPYGRVYNTPRIIALTGTYVEGIPQRVQFTITLRVNASAN